MSLLESCEKPITCAWCEGEYVPKKRKNASIYCSTRCGTAACHERTPYLAVEVDGATHKTKKWMFLDRRKTSVLGSLGWTVLRFWNKEVDEQFEEVTQVITFMISKLKESITTQPTA
jgi:hypothetical protein